MYNIPFHPFDWSKVPETESNGSAGWARSRQIELDGLRIRTIEYGPGYLADHWCRKGHVVYCLEGSFETEMENGSKIVLHQGMGYVVSDELSSHRSFSKDGVRILVIDGEFLNPKNNK